MPVPLAIVLPAYRTRFLREALASLETQTSRQFRLYVFDDASSEDVPGIVAGFRDRLPLEYHRFEENLGGKNLIAHWERCIARTGPEPWIWLFSDDDIAAPTCVEVFLDALTQDRNPVDLWRFDLEFIDEAGRVSHTCAPHPLFETASEFLENFLVPRGRDWRAADHIFSRRVYHELGGFIDFPNAIFSDTVTWLKFSTRSGVKTLRGPKLSWRLSSTNTTAQSFKRHRHIAKPLFMLHRWIEAFAKTLPADQQQRLRKPRREHFMDWISKWPVPPAGVRDALGVANELWPENKISNATRLLHGEIRAVAWRVPLARRYQIWRLRRASALATA
jgi:glycosyltransferase involved in cell wall biosynthesis